MIFLSPINSQLEVRDADVVLSTIELNLGLRKKERWIEINGGKREERGMVMMGERERERYPGNKVQRYGERGKLLRKWMFTEACTLDS